MKTNSSFSMNLFYSYSHRDQVHRERMEKSLSLLRDQHGVLKEWSDQQILPGQNITEEIKNRIKETDICVFLLSPDFLSSKPCMEEWELAGEIPSIIRVPIVVRECSWRDWDGMSQIKALPVDGKPITTFSDEDTAWQQVYEGLKTLIDELRKTFTIRDEYRKEIQGTEFLSQEHITLNDIFVFPVINSERNSEETNEKTIENEKELLIDDHVLIHGERLSGKTAICRHLYLSLIEQSVPVLYVDLDTFGRRANDDVFHESYERQFHGDYTLWSKQDNKLVILDNLSNLTIEHVTSAIECFEKVLVTVETDTYFAYYRDDERLAKFRKVEILPLTHSKQEMLIRNRIKLSSKDRQVLDGEIDEVENRVNSVIINNRILPRYPFYVLSILQTYEGYMPNDLSVTSYGHCYYVLIIAHLLRSGIARSDDEINSCMNFAENLAFEIYLSGTKEHRIKQELIEEFKHEYGKRFIPLRDSILNRLFDQNYGIITNNQKFGDLYQFRNPYMYYYFLGKYLARNCDKHKDVIESMVTKSYVSTNCLTLIFTIHHTTDDQIIEDIMLQTMCSLENIEPAILNRDETNVFEDIVKGIPSQVLSNESVQSERTKEREARDNHEFNSTDNDNESGDESLDAVNDIYRIMTNNEILGQILKNKYGSLERERIADTVETIVDGGLRLVSSLLSNQDEVNHIAVYLHERNPELDIHDIRKMIRLMSFLWTMQNVEKIVSALNKPEIRPVVQDVVSRKNTPSYDLVEYFLRLDTVKKFEDNDRRKLRSLLNKHDYPFFQKVVSFRTQRYLNTHKVDTPVEQAVCSILKLKYRSRVKSLT